MPRRGSNVTGIIGTAVVVILCLVGAAVLFNHFAPSLGLSSLQISQEQRSDTIDVTKQLRIAVLDEYAGSGISGATVNILDSSGLVSETLSTTSSGAATSNFVYKSGTNLILEVVAAGYVHAFVPVTVPKLSPADAQSLTYIPVTVKVPATPTITITATDKNGNAITDGGNFNMSGVTTATFTITVVNTKDDSGWKTTTDPVEKVRLGIAAVIEPKSPLVVTGAGTLVNRAGTTYVVVPIPDSAISRDVRGSTTVGGTYSFTITVNKGTLGSGSTADLTITVYEYFDQSYFSSYGSPGPYGIAAADFTVTIQG